MDLNSENYLAFEKEHIQLIHEQLPYQNALAYEMEKAPYYSKCILNFPSSTQITEDDIVYVVEQIKDVLMS